MFILITLQLLQLHLSTSPVALHTNLCLRRWDYSWMKILARFHQMELFAGGTSINTITAGGFITLEEGVTGKSFGTEFIVHEDGFGGKMETEDFARSVTFPDSGLNELDSYFPKFKHARDYALNRVKTDGTITQTGDVVTIQGVAAREPVVTVNESGDVVTIEGVEGVSNIISLEDGTGGILTEGGYFILGLEDWNYKLFQLSMQMHYHQWQDLKPYSIKMGLLLM